MKRLRFLLCGLLISFAALSGLHAQSSTAAFHLDLGAVDTLIDGNNRDTVPPLPGRAIGYDPGATDGYDAKFGEDEVYPGNINSLGLLDLFFDYPVGGEE